MFKSVLVGTLFAIALSSVAGAQNPSEADKRKRHLPYIRNATDCVANAVGRNPLFATAVESNAIGALLPDAVRACTDPMATMITMHDMIYGGGGMDFFKGPYLSDVERAVRSRLAPRIASMRADMERAAEQRKEAASKAAAERAERVASAEKVRDLIRERTMSCIGKQALPMLVTDEKAEVVAKAAMLFCEAEVNALVAATYDVISASGESANEANVRVAARKRVEEVVTAHIIKAKAELILNSQSNRDREKAPAAASPTL